MRRGFSLVEILIVVMTVPLVAVVVDRVFREMSVEIPRGVDAVNEHERLLGVIETLHGDVEGATVLTLVNAVSDAGTPVLRIEQPNRRITYTVQSEGLRYEITGSNLDPNRPAQWEWSLPRADIAWHLWEKEGSVRAVCVETSMNLGYKGRKIFQNTHLFFLGTGLVKESRHALP